MSALVPCSSCDRFVRSLDRACPFCGAALTPREVPSGRKHVARATMMAIALAATGCSDSTEMPMPLYGGPPVDAGDMTDSGADDAELPAPLYGGPPVDAGDEMTDAGELPAPAYGAFPVDGG